MPPKILRMGGSSDPLDHHCQELFGELLEDGELLCLSGHDDDMYVRRCRRDTTRRQEKRSEAGIGGAIRQRGHRLGRHSQSKEGSSLYTV